MMAFTSGGTRPEVVVGRTDDAMRAGFGKGLTAASGVEPFGRNHVVTADGKEAAEKSARAL